MRKLVSDLREFHARFGVPTGEAPRLLSAFDFAYRFAFLHEELAELEAAHAAGDLAEVADALVDLIYVAAGTALWAGLDLEAHWDAVHAANLRKVPVTSPTSSKRGHGADVVKPPGWVPPDHHSILQRQK